MTEADKLIFEYLQEPTRNVKLSSDERAVLDVIKKLGKVSTNDLIRHLMPGYPIKHSHFFKERIQMVALINKSAKMIKASKRLLQLGCVKMVG